MAVVKKRNFFSVPSPQMSLLQKFLGLVLSATLSKFYYGRPYKPDP